MQKTIFITGASTGLGKETAKFFQSKGWNVIATVGNFFGHSKGLKKVFNVPDNSFNIITKFDLLTKK